MASRNSQECSELDPADMISSLPDSVLSHCLFFLPTKYAVATSVLSKRWEFLWKQIHSLDFDDSMPSIRQSVGQAQDAGQRMTFPQFVERVMLLRNSKYTMEKFHIKSSCNANHISTWIRSAIAAGVWELSLSVYAEGLIQLSRQLFTCNTLVVLKLSGGQILIYAQLVRFPYLKTLHLSSVKYQNDAAVSQLISSCLVLENLVLENLSIRPTKPDNVINFDISSHTLKRLTIYFYSCAATDEIAQAGLNLDTPQLQFLKTWGKFSAMDNVKLPSLHEANVHAHPNFIRYSFQFIRRLNNVKVLCLSTCSKFLWFWLELKTFCNLTHLKLEGSFCIWGLLGFLFCLTPNLESLTYQERKSSCHLQHRKIIESPSKH